MFALPPQSEPRCFVMSYGYEPRNASPTPSHDRNSSKHKTLKTHSNNMTIVLWLATPYAHAHLFLALSPLGTLLSLVVLVVVDVIYPDYSRRSQLLILSLSFACRFRDFNNRLLGHTIYLSFPPDPRPSSKRLDQRRPRAT